MELDEIETPSFGQFETRIAGSNINRINKDTKTAYGLSVYKISEGICNLHVPSGSGPGSGTGFLCEFKDSNNMTLKGLFTCNHVVNCYGEFQMVFHHKKYRHTVKPHDVEWIITDRNLDFTFISFHDSLIQTFRKQVRFFFDVRRSPLPYGSKIPIMILHHPEGGKLSMSEGAMLMSNTNKIHHEASTLAGSSGSPILDKNFDVVGIHNKGSRIIDARNAFAEFNIGTLITHVFDAISSQKPWDSQRWKRNHNHHIDSSALILLNEAIDKDLLSASSSLCSINLIIRKTKYYGNGFLCRVNLLTGDDVYGIFTSNHLLLKAPFPLSRNSSFSMGFTDEKSSLTILPSHIKWVYPDIQHKFTFIALNSSFLNEPIIQKRKFLSLANAKPAANSTFYLLQHEQGKQAAIFKGNLEPCKDIYLLHSDNGVPHVHGSLILNSNFEALGIGHTCGPSQQLGTCIALDIVGRLLTNFLKKKSISEAMLVENYLEKNINQPAGSVCKIVSCKLPDVTFTGFLFSVPYENELIEGLLTHYQISSEKELDGQTFTIHFDSDNTKVEVQTSNQMSFISDKSLEFTFIPFQDEFIKVSEINASGIPGDNAAMKTMKNRSFLSAAQAEPPLDSKIFLLHHPNGDKVSVSEGTLKQFVENDLHHFSDTRPGSAGGPILDVDYGVIGFHKSKGPLDDTGEPMYKIGTNIHCVVEKIKTEFRERYNNAATT